MKTAKQFWTKLVTVSAILSLAASGWSQTIRLSQEPATNTAGLNDLFLVDSSLGGGNYATRVITLQNLSIQQWANAVASMQDIGNGAAGGIENTYKTVAPAFTHQLGISANSAYAGLYYGTGTGTGNWKGSFLMNGYQQWGSATNMVGAGGHVIYYNGDPTLQFTNGPTGVENGIELIGMDPKQICGITFSAPGSGSGPYGSPGGVVLNQANGLSDFGIGMGGWVYGTNTLAGLGMANDANINLNPGHDLLFTTTENAGSFGAREFLGWDWANAIWHIDADVSGNGTYKNAGHKDMAWIDTKVRSVNLSNAFFNFFDPHANNSVTMQGSADFGPVGVTPANAFGVERFNTGNVGVGTLFVNNTATPGGASILLANGYYLNVDANGDFNIGKFVNNNTNDYLMVFKSDSSLVIHKTNEQFYAKVSVPTITITNSPTFATTNAAPADTTTRAWVVFTNGASRFAFPAAAYP